MNQDDTCYVCIRIDAETFYNELKALEFTPEEAREIIGWVRQIYEVNPTFLCGHASKTIKGALAYIGAVVFKKSHPLEEVRTDYKGRRYTSTFASHSQRQIGKYFNCTEASVRSNYQWIGRFMERHKICVFKGWNE